MELEEVQRGWINLGLIGVGKVSMGAGWWEVLVVRDRPAAG